LLLQAAILDSTVHAMIPKLSIYEMGNTVARRPTDHAQTWLCLNEIFDHGSAAV